MARVHVVKLLDSKLYLQLASTSSSLPSRCLDKNIDRSSSLFHANNYTRWRMIDNRLIGRASSFSEIQNIPPFEKRGARNRFEFSYNEYKLNPLVVSFFFFFLLDSLLDSSGIMRIGRTGKYLFRRREVGVVRKYLVTYCWSYERRDLRDSTYKFM